MMDNIDQSTTGLCPLVAISPHYDDAVFSCAGLLIHMPRSTVITVCTACPSQSGVLTDWDGRCGFADAAQAMEARRAENKKALSILQAKAIDLDFLDAQYLNEPQNGTDLLMDTFALTLSQLHPSTVVFPLGLFHTDHIRVADALITLSPHLHAMTWIAYEDNPYCRQVGCVETRIAQLAQMNVRATRCMGAPFVSMDEDASSTKQLAVNAYESQFRGLGYDDAQPIMRQPERYWRLQASVELL